MMAVGSFERTGGAVSTSAEVSAIVFDQGDADASAKPNQEVFSKSDAFASFGNENGFAQYFADGIAFNITRIGNDIVAPFVSAKGQLLYNVTGLGFAIGEEFSGAGGEYAYNMDPEYTEDLVLNVHFYLVATGGAVDTGDAYHWAWLKLGATADAYTAVATYDGDSFNVSGTLPDGPFFFDSGAGVNSHIAFQMPFNGLGLDLSAFTGVDQDGSVGGYANHFLGEGNWGMTVAAWAYVTPDGVDLTPGDFNADGVVNVDDYQLWQSDDPRADADMDADVDNDDYEIWAANAPGAIIVSTEIDELDVDYSSGDLSLREALYIANVNAGLDYIVFAPDVNLITLGLGQLSVNSDVIIAGHGADTLEINGDASSRVLHIDSGDTATISGVTITNGDSDVGGGIYVQGTLNLHSAVVSNNQSPVYGGGIYVDGTLNLMSSTVEENVADYGGGLFLNAYGYADIQNSSIDNNTADWGGGVYAYVGAGERLVIDSSSVSENIASVGAGGLILRGSTSGAAVTIVNSTISTNEATYSGGIRAQEGISVDIVNSTIAFNQGGEGGGIWLYQATVALNNTILAENTNLAGTVDLDVSNFWGLDWSNSYNNLIGRGGAYGFSDGDLHDNLVLSALESALLGSLANNGGSTRTHELLTGSQAIDNGDDDYVTLYDLAFDQRGEGYDRIIDGGSSLQVDIGAFEYSS